MKIFNWHLTLIHENEIRKEKLAFRKKKNNLALFIHESGKYPKEKKLSQARAILFYENAVSEFVKAVQEL